MQTIFTKIEEREKCSRGKESYGNIFWPGKFALRFEGEKDGFFQSDYVLEKPW
jgi:hypothetical protein